MLRPVFPHLTQDTAETSLQNLQPFSPLLGWSVLPREQGWPSGFLLSTPSPASLPPGTSLLQEVVYLVSQGADPDEIGLMNIDEQLPVLEYPQPGLDIIKVGSGQASQPM